MPESECRCSDTFLRTYENTLRHHLFWDSLDDDSIFEPWLTLRATCVTPPDGVWGLGVEWESSGHARGARRWIPPIQRPDDAEKMVAPHHEIDEESTARNLARLSDAVGDLIEIAVDRGPAYQVWNGDISTQLAYLRGIQQIMYDMVDRPEWLHSLLAFMRDGIRRTHEQAEEMGHWTLTNHENQAMCYSEELSDPAAGGEAVLRKDLWYYCASQETTVVGPKMFAEFMLDYQASVFSDFGLVAYGCCEDLTEKIDLLKQLPNLRRIAVAPLANVAKCAERIGDGHVLSYRPNPTDTVSCGFDEDHIRKVLRQDLTACRDCHVDIALKDVETVEGDPNRVRRWVGIARETIGEVFG